MDNFQLKRKSIVHIGTIVFVAARAFRAEPALTAIVDSYVCKVVAYRHLRDLLAACRRAHMEAILKAAKRRITHFQKAR